MLGAIIAVPFRGSAACEMGGRLDTGDVTSVQIRRSTFPLGIGPQYGVSAQRQLRSVGGGTRYIASATLSTYSAQPLPRGPYVLGSSDDAETLLRALADELQRSDFFSMRLTPLNAWPIDVPSESVSVLRCGVRTTLATVGESIPWRRADENGKRFVALIDRLSAIVFAQPWMSAPQPSPSPSATP